MPLHFFYAREERPIPAPIFLAPESMPEAEQALLWHDRDMTSTLTAYHDSPLGLHVIEKEASDGAVIRLVVLQRLNPPQRPVEFGAIMIYLEAFPEESRAKIIAGTMPLGAILEADRVPFVSEPKGFFWMEADDFIADLLAEEEGVRLYGRCNALSTPDGVTLADIVEVLPRIDR
jgi:chorismate-pyruvate lyase